MDWRDLVQKKGIGQCSKYLHGTRHVTFLLLSLMRTPQVKITTNVSLLSVPLQLQECLAKTRKEIPQDVAGRGIADPSNIVGEVAMELLARMPAFLRTALFSVSSERFAAWRSGGIRSTKLDLKN
jgi:hypothetical protein